MKAPLPQVRLDVEVFFAADRLDRKRLRAWVNALNAGLESDNCTMITGPFWGFERSPHYASGVMAIYSLINNPKWRNTECPVH